MLSYLVETHLGQVSAEQRLDREQRAHSAAERLTVIPGVVRFEHSIHVPDDEIGSMPPEPRRRGLRHALRGRPNSMRFVALAPSRPRSSPPNGARFGVARIDRIR